jgi:BON domain
MKEIFMPRKETQYQPKKVHGNFGPGGFSDQYDNEHMRSVDRDLNPGGVTGIPFEDEIDLDDMKFAPEKGESRFGDQFDRSEPPRDADLSLGEAGTNWNRELNRKPFLNEVDYSGKGPRGWKLTDQKMMERVCEVLLHSHEVDPTDIEVFVKDHVVTLKGKIRSKGMRRVAEDLVGSVPGVRDVFSELKIN